MDLDAAASAKADVPTCVSKVAPGTIVSELGMWLRKWEWDRFGRQMTQEDYERAASEALIELGYVIPTPK